VIGWLTKAQQFVRIGPKSNTAPFRSRLNWLSQFRPVFVSAKESLGRSFIFSAQHREKAMKHPTKLARLKLRKHARLTQRTPGGQEGDPSGRWLWVGLIALCLLLGGAGTWAAFEFLVWTKVPPELVGTWEVEEGAQQGGTFQFLRNGTLIVHLDNQGTDVSFKARAALEGRTLRTTLNNPNSNLEETRKSTIRELTAKTLVLEFESGEVLRMVRWR
jgi:uncharacterized protein (TIGR03066 family)